MSGARSTRRAVLAGVGAAGLALSLAPLRARADWLERGKQIFEDTIGDGGTGGLSDARIGQGLKAALEVASQEVVERVGRPGGYLEDPQIHIPLPGYLADVQPTLEMLGAGALLGDVERRLNRGAEKAAPHAERLFLDAIGQLTLDDARTLLNGPDDAATQYFRRTTGDELRRTFRPVVREELGNAGAIGALREVSDSLAGVPFADSLGQRAEARLIDHGLDGALDGLFHYLAREEAAIRNNPAARTRDILKEVFG